MTRLSVWRIGYCPSPLPDHDTLLRNLGVGATLFDGRWHTRTGKPLVYAASSRALSQLEKRVHANGVALKHQVLMRLDLPAKASLEDVVAHGLPADWAQNPAVTRAIGDAWLASGASLGLWVPSVVEPLERNLLLNPGHGQYGRIALAVERDPFNFDGRLF